MVTMVKLDMGSFPKLSTGLLLHCFILVNFCFELRQKKRIKNWPIVPPPSHSWLLRQGCLYKKGGGRGGALPQKFLAHIAGALSR